MDLGRGIMDTVMRIWVWKLVSVLVLVMALTFSGAYGNVVFKVQHKYKGTGKFSLAALKAHDARRHGRMLFDIHIPLGGNGNPADSGLYFTKLRIGNPSNDYYVQVDTGSDILWVNCAGCDKCPTRSDIGIKLSLYDPKESSTAQMVTCEDDSCAMIYSGTLSGCKPQALCYYEVTYGDGSTTAGFFVQDDIHFDKVSGNLQTSTGNGSVVFGCGAKQGGQLSSSGEALDGIVGFGQANSSMISQLAASRKVKKMFSHCLDGSNGGGIFAIGEVVQPKLNSTPLVPNQAHYNVMMKSIEVAGDVIQFSTEAIISGSYSPAILDSGTTLAYLPDAVYNALMSSIIAQQPDLKIHTLEDTFRCFQYSSDVDKGFPAVKFHFVNSVTLVVHPHEYLFEVQDEVWCFGWQNSGLQSKDGRDVTLLGDLVLSNKLVFYDLENQVVGLTEYNCSSSIKVKGESGSVYTVDAQVIAGGNSLIWEARLTFLFLLVTSLFITRG